jgi:hypothetical protein
MEGINEAQISGRGEARAIVEIQAKRGQNLIIIIKKEEQKRRKSVSC